MGSKDEHKTPFSLSAPSATANLHGCCPEEQEGRRARVAEETEGEATLSEAAGRAAEKSLRLCGCRGDGR